ncbi:MAG: hypothetical protein K2H94_07605 [Duncaniella sp.]|nr:hypothetical protein [Duncaniella sp.]
MGRLGRWWRSKGHGIHSPLAFRLVTGVLRDHGCVWYGYGRLCGDYERMLFRVACEFDPRCVTVPEGTRLTPPEREAFRAARSTVRFSKSLPGHEAEPFIFLAADPETLALPRRGVVFVRRCSGRSLLGPEDRGICLTDGRMALLVMRPDLTPQTFEVNFS